MKNYVYLKNGTKVVIIDTLASGKWIVEPIVEYQLEEGVPMSMAMGKVLVTDEVYNDRPKKEDIFFTRELKDNEYEYKGVIVQKMYDSYTLNFPRKVEKSEFEYIEGIVFVFGIGQRYSFDVEVAKAFNDKAVIQNIIDSLFPKESVSLDKGVDFEFEFVPNSPKKKAKRKTKDDLSAREKQIINYLKEHKEGTATEVAKGIGLNASSYARTALNKLIRNGHVIRHFNFYKLAPQSIFN